MNVGSHLVVSAPASVASDRVVNAPDTVTPPLPAPTAACGAALPFSFHTVGVAKDFALSDQPCAFLHGTGVGSAEGGK